MFEQRPDDRLVFGSVISLVLPVQQGREHPSHKEKERFVVLSFQVPPEGFPRTCYLDFYQNEKKFQERCRSAQILLDKAKFCGLITGTRNNPTRDRYVALLFTTFTAIITLKGCDPEKSDRLISACRNITSDHFGNFKTCRAQFVSYPPTEKRTFDKERTGYVILSLATKRISIFSETHSHLCLYFWPLEKVELVFEDDKVRLDVLPQAEHHGMYYFACEKSKDIRQWAAMNGLRIYDSIKTCEKPLKFSVPAEASASVKDLCGSLQSLSQTSVEDAQQTNPFSPKPHSTNSSGSSVPSFSNESIDNLYLTMINRELEFDFDVNNYVLKHEEELNRALRSPPSGSAEEDPDIYNIGEQLLEWMKARSPGRDTLKLTSQTRYRLCTRLNEKSCIVGQEEKTDWELLATYIGMTMDTISLIKATANKGLLCCPAAEIVFRHWQYMYNRYDVTDPMGKCPFACTKDGLVTILGKLKRNKLIELITEC